MRTPALLLGLLTAFWTLPALAEPAKFFVLYGQVNTELQLAGPDKSIPSARFREAAVSFCYDKTDTSLSRVRLALNPGSVVPNTQPQPAFVSQLSKQEISFVADGATFLKDGKGKIDGILNLNGVSKTVQAEVTLNAPSATAASLSLRIGVKRMEFNFSDVGEAHQGDDLSSTADAQAMGH